MFVAPLRTGEFFYRFEALSQPATVIPPVTQRRRRPEPEPPPTFLPPPPASTFSLLLPFRLLPFFNMTMIHLNNNNTPYLKIFPFIFTDITKCSTSVSTWAGVVGEGKSPRPKKKIRLRRESTRPLLPALTLTMSVTKLSTFYYSIQVVVR